LAACWFRLCMPGKNRLTAMPCDADTGVVIDVLGCGELEPCSPNDTASGLTDNRRVDMLFTGGMQMRDGSTIRTTEAPAVIKPRLNVSGPVPAVFQLQPSAPVPLDPDGKYAVSASCHRENAAWMCGLRMLATIPGTGRWRSRRWV
jgi:hypothetical protein